MELHPPRRKRLPVVVPPRPGESFASWIDRFSGELEIPPGLLVDALGLDVIDPIGGAYGRYGVSLTDRELLSIEASTSTSRETVALTLLDRYAGILYRDDVAPRARSRRARSLHLGWVLPRASRGCRLCLTDSPVWLVQWKLGFSAVCLRHAVMLIDRCHTCGTELRLQHKSKEPLYRSRLVTPSGCRGVVGGRLCGEDLSRGHTCSAPLDVLDHQQALLRVLDTGDGLIAGHRVDTRTWFETYITLASFVRFSITPSSAPTHGLEPSATTEIADYCRRRDTSRENRSGHVNAKYLHRPESANWAAIISREVIPIMTATGPDDAAQHLSALHERVEAQRTAMGRPVLGCHMPLAGPLGEIWSQLETHRRAIKAGARVAAHAPTTPQQGAGDAVFDSIPQLIDAVRYTRVIAPLLPGTAPPTGRCFAALAVARHRGAHSWGAAGETIGIGRRKAIQRADVMVRRVADAPAFWSAVAELADELESLPHVNYRERRRQLANLHRLPDDPFARTATKFGLSATDRSNRCAAAWVWGELVGGDWRESPALEAWPAGATAESRREKVRQFLKVTPAPMLDELLDMGHELLEGQ
jgi:hypothetical protein